MVAVVAVVAAFVAVVGVGGCWSAAGVWRLLVVDWLLF